MKGKNVYIIKEGVKNLLSFESNLFFFNPYF